MEEIIYKSKYAQVCDEIGEQKPPTQEMEEYCQIVEFEHPEFAAKILTQMSGRNITENDLGWTFKVFLSSLRKMVIYE